MSIAISAIMLVAIVFVIGAQTFSWFDQERSAVNSDLTLGELNVEITLYKYGFNGSVIDPALTSVQSGDYPNGIFDEDMTWQIGSHGVTYIKVENFGNIDARVYMNLFLNGATALTDYDYNYIYVSFTDVTNTVNAIADNPTLALTNPNYKLESYAESYNATYNTDPSYYHSQIISNAKTVGQYMEDKYQLSPSVIPQRENATTPTVRYFRMDYCENNMPSAFLAALSNKSKTVSDFTATFFIKQGNYTENAATSSETFVVDTDTSFIEAVKIAQNGDTIILSNDIVFTTPINITFYNRVNLDLNGYRLHIKGNMAYDVVSFGSCYINVMDSSELIVDGDLIIDAPATAFTINGTGNYGIRLGTFNGLHTTNGRFYAKTISDNKSGFTLSNIRVVKTQTDGNGTYLNNEKADLELGSNTALCVMSGTEIGKITAENKAYCISVTNYGIIDSIDFSGMSYAGLGQDQIYISNCNRIMATNPSIILPYWSRGHISAYDPLDPDIDYDDLSEKDPVDAQVNTTVSRGAGSVDGMTVGVKFHYDPNSNINLPVNSFSAEEGYIYIAENRAEARLYYSTTVSPADIDFVNYIYFYNVDIKNDNSSAQNVIRVSANNYIVMLFGDAMPDKTPESLQLRLEEYFAGVGSAYAGEAIHSLTLRTYNTATITAADFAYMNSSAMYALTTLDLSAAVMDNGEIPASALESRKTLANLTLPITVCTIGDNAFKDTSIHFVKVGDNVQSIGTDAFLVYDRTSATAAYRGYTFISWTSGINIPTAVSNGFNSEYNIIFMNRSLLNTFRTTNSAFELKSYEIYDGVLFNNFYKYTGVNSVRIVYYHGTAMNDMVPDSMMLDRNGTGTAEYYVTSVGDSAYRLSIYELNNNTNKTDAEKFISLSFRNNLEDVGDYAFKGGRFSTLSLNKVKTLGIGTFQNTYIQKSLARPAGETLTGLGDYCFENAVIGYELNTDDVSTIGNAFYNNCVTVSPSGKFSYTIGNTTTYFDYNGGILDLSGNYSIPLHAFQNMKVFGTEFTIKSNRRLEKTKLSDTVEQGPFDGTMFYGCYIELNGLEIIKSDVFANKINTGFNSLQNYSFLNIRNVKQLNGNVFEGCNVNTVYIGIDSGKYVDQMHVDYLVDTASPTDRNCQYKSSNTKPVFYNAKIRNIDVSGWLPTETTDNDVGIFAAYVNTNYENVRFHDMSSNRVPGNMFSSYDTYTLTIDNLDVDMTMDCYVGANCFKGSVLNNAVFVAPGKLIIETSAFEDADVTAFTRFINPTRSLSDNRLSEVWANAFQNATFSHTPVEINLSACTRLEACAFNATTGIVGSVVVGPAITSLKHDTFSSTKITSLELKGVTTINDTSAPGVSPFENCKQLVVLKAPALIDLTPRLNGLTSLTELYLGTAGEDPGYMIGAATMFEVEPDITNFHIFVPDANYLSYFRTIMADKYKTSVVLAHNGVSAAGYAAGDNIADYTYNGVEIGHYVLSLNDDNVTYRVVGVNSAYSSTSVNNSTITYSPSGVNSTAPLFASDSALVVPDSVTLRNGGGIETVNGIEYGSVRYAKITTVTFDAGVKTFGYAGYHATFGTTVTFPNADYNVIAGNKMQMASLVFPNNSYIGQYAFYGCTMPNMVTLTVGPGSTIGKQAFSTCSMTNALTKTITLDGVLVIGDQAFANMIYGATPIDIHATDVGVIGAGALAIADRVGDVTLGISGADSSTYCWGGTSGSDTDAGIFAYGTGTITVDSLKIVGKVPANSLNSALAGYCYSKAGTKLIYKEVDLTACTQLTPYAFYAGTPTKSYAYTEIQNTAALTIGCGAPDYSFYYCYFPNMTSLTVNGDVGNFAFNHASFTSLKQLSVSAGHTINDDAFSYSSWGATGTKSVNFDDCTYMGVRAMAALTVSNDLVDVSALNVGVIKAAALGSHNLGKVKLGVATDDASYKWGGDYTLWENDPTSGVFTYVEPATIVVDKLIIVGDVPTGISALAGHIGTYKTLVEFNNVDLSACTKLNVQSFTSGGASYYRDKKTVIHNMVSPVLNCDIGDSCFELCVIENVSSLTVSSGHTIGTKAFCDIVWDSTQDITITIDGCSSVGTSAFAGMTTTGKLISINALNITDIGPAALASDFETVKVGVADASSATWGGAYSLEGKWPDVQAGIFTKHANGSVCSINKLIIIGATPDCESALAGGGGANTNERRSTVTFGKVDLTNCTKIGNGVFTSGTNSTSTCTIIQNLVTTASGSSITCNIGDNAFAYCKINNFDIAVINGDIGDTAFKYATVTANGALSVVGDVGTSAFMSATVNGFTTLSVTGNIGDTAFKSAVITATGALTVVGDVGTSAFVSAKLYGIPSVSVTGSVGNTCFQKTLFDAVTSLTVSGASSTIGTSAFIESTWRAVADKMITLDGITSVGQYAFYAMSVSDGMASVSAKDVGIIAAGAFATNFDTVTLGVQVNDASYSWGGVSDGDPHAGIFAKPSANTTTTINRLVIDGCVPDGESSLGGRDTGSGGWYASTATYNTVDLTKCTRLAPYAFICTATNSYTTTINNLVSTSTNKIVNCDVGACCFAYCKINNFDIGGFTGSLGDYCFKSATITGNNNMTFPGALGTGAFYYATVNGTAAMVFTKDIPSYCFYYFTMASTATLTLNGSTFGDKAFYAAKLNGVLDADPVTLGAETFHYATIAQTPDTDELNWNNLTSMGTSCFSDTTLPKFVTMNSITELPQSAFSNCNIVSFTSTSLTTISGSNNFRGDTKLERLVIPNCQMAYDMFYSTGKIHEIYIGHLTASSGLYNSNCIVYDCGATLPAGSYKTLSGLRIYCIDDCTYNTTNTIYTGTRDPYTLKGYDYYKFDSTCVLEIPRYVGYEDASGNVTIVGCNVSKMENLTLTLTTVTDKEGNVHNVTSVGPRAFRYVTMTNVTLDLSSAITSVGNYAFAKGSAKTLVIPDNKTNTYDVGDYGFQSATITGGNMTFSGDLGTNAFESATVTGSGAVEFTGDLGTSAFTSSNLTANTMTFTGTVGTTAFKSASLTASDAIEFTGDLGTNAFESASVKGTAAMVVTKNIPNYCFKSFNLANTATLTLSSTCQTIGDYAFQSATVSGVFTADPVTLGTYAFYNASIANMTGDTMTWNKVTTVGTYCFHSASLPKYVVMNGLTEVPLCCFYSCKNIASFTAENLLRFTGNDVFAYCKSIERVVVPKCTVLTRGMFYVASKLHELYVGHLTTIGIQCFECASSYIIAYECGDDLPGGSYVSSSRTRVYCIDACTHNTTRTIYTGTRDPYTLKGYDYYKYDDTCVLEIPRYVGYEDPLSGNVTLVGCNSTALTGTVDLTTVTDKAENVHNVTAIGNNAFRYVTMTNVELTLNPNTSSVGNYAFYADTTYPKSVTTATLSFLANTTIGTNAFQSCTFTSMTGLSLGTNSVVGNNAFKSCSFPSLTALTIGSGSTVGDAAFYGTKWNAETDKTITVTDCASLGTQAFCGMTHLDGEITVLATGIRTMGSACLGSDFKSVTVGLSTLDGTETWGGAYTIGYSDSTTGVFAASTGAGKVTVGTLTVSGKIPDCTSCLAGHLYQFTNSYYSKVEIGKLDLSGCTHLGTGCFNAGTDNSTNSNTYSVMVIDITDGLSINVDVPADCFRGVVFRGDSTVTTAGANTITVANGKSIGNNAFRYCYHDVTKAISLGDNVTVGTYAFANSVYNSLKDFAIGDTATVGDYAIYKNTFSSALTLAIGDNATVGDYVAYQSTFGSATTVNVGNHCNVATYVFSEITSPVSLTVNIGYGGAIGSRLFDKSKLNNVNMTLNTVPVGETATTVAEHCFGSATSYANSTWIINNLVHMSDNFFNSANGTNLSIYCFGTVTVGTWLLWGKSGTAQIYFDSALTTFYGNNTFGTGNLKVIMTSPVPPTNTDSIFANMNSSTVKFYVPLNLLNTYKTTAPWSSVASLIYPIENDIDGWKYKILSGDDTNGYDISVSGYYGSTAIANGVLTIPASLTKGGITYRIVQLDDGLLDGGICTTITSIRIPTSVYSIDVKLFDEDVTANAIQTVQVAVGSQYYRAGTTVVGGYTVGPLLESADGTALYRVMGDYYEANGISSITLDYSVIYAGALNCATAIEEVTLGANITVVPDKLFNTGTTNVKRITFSTAVPPIVFGNAAFGDIVIVGVVGTETVYQVGSGCAIYVPAGSESIYKTSIGFVRYALAIQATPNP